MKKIVITFTALLILCISFFFFLIHKRLQVIEEISYTPGCVVRQDSSLIIAVLGDSWADNGRKFNLGKMIDERFCESGIISHTFVSGMQGAKTSQIYQNLFNDSTINGTSHIIHKFPRYCVLLMGLNDLNGQYGHDYYVHHTLLIVNYLNSMGIIPIIYHIPNVNYLNLYNKYPLTKKFAYKLLSLITSGKTSLDNRDLYIEKLNHSLGEIKAKYIVANADFLIHNNKIYLQDDIHLNEKGYIELSKSIYQYIVSSNY